MLKLDLVLFILLYVPVLALVIATGIIGNWWLALIAFSILLSRLVGVNVDRNMKKI